MSYKSGHAASKELSMVHTSLRKAFETAVFQQTPDAKAEIEKGKAELAQMRVVIEGMLALMNEINGADLRDVYAVPGDYFGTCEVHIAGYELYVLVTCEDPMKGSVYAPKYEDEENRKQPPTDLATFCTELVQKIVTNSIG